MKKHFFIAFLFFGIIAVTPRAQAQLTPDPPKENDALVSQDTTQEGSGNEMGEDVLQREKYYLQRYAYPNATIPRGAYRKAIEYARTMPRYYNKGNATTLSANTWKNVGPINIG